MISKQWRSRNKVHIGRGGGGGGGAVSSMDLASSLALKFLVTFNDAEVQLNIVWGL